MDGSEDKNQDFVTLTILYYYNKVNVNFIQRPQKYRYRIEDTVEIQIIPKKSKQEQMNGNSKNRIHKFATNDL